MFSPECYTATCAIFTRLLGLIYFFAFFPFIFQIKGLLGKNGILPVSDFLHMMKLYYKKKRFYQVPTLFWLNDSNSALTTTAWTGSIISLCLFCGIYPTLCLGILYILYLSIVSSGQDFLGFGWEMFLLEITFNTFFLSMTETPNLMIWISLNILLFRFHLQAGAVKLQSHDVNWRNLTACSYHYQTQPIPNKIAWYAHKMPLWFHKISCACMFIIEILVPFAIFFDDTTRAFTFVALFGLQCFIYLTGNFSYLNHMTAIFCVILLNNSLFTSFYTAPVEACHSPTLDIALTCIGSTLAILQLMQLWHHFFPNRLFHRLFLCIMPWHIVNRYGIFAVMTTKRYEIVVEGSHDGHIWQEYAFRHKPSEIDKSPRRISPYQPRLDWQAWFLPFTNFSEEAWFHYFLGHLLAGTPDVLALLRYNPFSDNPPRYIRARVYDYQFSSWEEKQQSGVWWKRICIGNYSPILQRGVSS